MRSLGIMRRPSSAVLFGALVLTLAACSIQAQQVQDQKSTKKLRPFVPPPTPATLPDCPKTPHWTFSDLDAQADIVLGKEKRVLALLREVSTWFEVNPKHPTALDSSRELRRFMGEFSDEDGKLLYMARQVDRLRAESNDTTRSLSEKATVMEGVADKLKKTTDNSNQIVSGLRQLEAMGFEVHGNGWNEPRWTVTRTLDADKGCYIEIGSMR